MEFTQMKNIPYKSKETETGYTPFYDWPNPFHTMQVNVSLYKID